MRAIDIAIRSNDMPRAARQRFGHNRTADAAAGTRYHDGFAIEERGGGHAGTVSIINPPATGRAKA